MFTPALLSAPQPQGLLIPRCPSVHGFFMRYALDIVYLNDHDAEHAPGSHQNFQVTHTDHLKPWRVSFGKRWHRVSAEGMHAVPSRHTLELPTGSILAMEIAPGDRLEVRGHE